MQSDTQAMNRKLDETLVRLRQLQGDTTATAPVAPIALVPLVRSDASCPTSPTTSASIGAVKSCLTTCDITHSRTRVVPDILVGSTQEFTEAIQPDYQICAANCAGTVNGYECSDRGLRLTQGMSSVWMRGVASDDALTTSLLDTIQQSVASCMINPSIIGCQRNCDSRLDSDADNTGWRICLAACSTQTAMLHASIPLTTQIFSQKNLLKTGKTPAKSSSSSPTITTDSKASTEAQAKK